MIENKFLKSMWVIPIIILLFAILQFVLDKSFVVPSLMWLALSLSLFVGMTVSLFVERKLLWGSITTVLSFMIINVGVLLTLLNTGL